MDGKVLLDAIEPAFAEANPVRKIKTWDEQVGVPAAGDEYAA